jgi:V8-like Glu-specific endopeptidase
MKKLGAFLTVGLLLSCAQTEYGSTPPEEGVQEPIVGGTDDTDDPAVAGLFSHLPGQTQGFLCTSTLIAPRVLLTAAHCVAPSEVGDGAVFVAIFANALKGAPQLEVVETRFDPLFDKNNITNGHDIGVAILKNPVTDVRPIPYIRQTLTQELAGNTIRLIGYGLNNGFDTQGTSAGTKRTLVTSLNSIDAVTISVGKLGSTSCSGDSGGPGLVQINGVETVVGVTSYGIIYCLSAGFYTRVDLYTPFIDKAVADAGGGGGGGCTPSCAGKQCGDDACGGQCPSQCAPGDVCTPAGQCRPGHGGGGCPDETEGNETVETANPLCAGGTINGTLGSANDIDTFSVDVPANHYYTFLLQNSGPKYTVAVFKKSTAGKILTVGTGTAVGDDVVFTKRTTTGGTYYVKVSAADPSVDASNVYSLYAIMSQ